MKNEAATGKQEIEAFGMDLPSALDAMTIHRLESGPRTPVKGV
jgi:hypothetical protein